MTTNEEFWSAAADGRLVLPECGGCGGRFFPPAPSCPTCLSADWTWIACSGTGTVYSHTTCTRPHIAGIETPYVLAIVELDEGWTLLTNIVGQGHLDVRTGDPVAVAFEPRPQGDATPLAPVFSLTPGDAQ